ncbi:MAG: aminotransferase class V-fold PLP-dependent enzyme [Nanoarchaeota archaeon]|nr:aminotransferase class V-fold PLP-dependent enzyme [Nanoarchaeota archaeon]
MNPEKLRQDFPVLNKGIIYLDSACMTLRPRPVIEAINQYYNEFPACGERSEHQLGKKVSEEVDKARRVMARFIGAKEKEIIFTKNTTEAINLIAHSQEKDSTILTTDKEHNSNLLPWQRFNHQYTISNPDNTFNLEDFQNKIKGTKLVAMGWTSNLDGVSIPVKEIIKIAHENNTLVLLDGAQAVPHKETNIKKLDADFLAFSGHKMCGPTGTGILYGKQDLLKELKPFILGGGTVKESWYNKYDLEEVPERFEGGLQNYAGIIGLAAAANYLKNIGLDNIQEHEIKLNKKITEELINEVELIGPKNPEQRGSIFSFNIKGIDLHEIAHLLDSSAKIAVRSGAHCVHSWFNAHQMKGSVRASTYFYNTLEEAEKFVEEVKKIVRFLK